jgi:hypothetical protein
VVLENLATLTLKVIWVSWKGDKIVVIVLRWCHKDVTRELQGCYKGVTRVLQGSYKGVTRASQGRHKGVTRVLQENYKGVTRVFCTCSSFACSSKATYRVLRGVTFCYVGSNCVLL